MGKFKDSFKTYVDQAMQPSTYDARFGQFVLQRGRVKTGFVSYPATECTASITETGTAEDTHNSGAGGAVAGAMIAGPIGAIAFGSSTHISRNKGWFVLRTPGGTKQVKLNGRQRRKFVKARQFVMNLQLEKERQQYN